MYRWKMKAMSKVRICPLAPPGNKEGYSVTSVQAEDKKVLLPK